MRTLHAVATSFAALVAVGLSGSSTSASTSWTRTPGSSDDNDRPSAGLPAGQAPDAIPGTFAFPPGATEPKESVNEMLSTVLQAKTLKVPNRVSAQIKGDFSAMGPALDSDELPFTTSFSPSDSQMNVSDDTDRFTSCRAEVGLGGYAPALLPRDWCGSLSAGMAHFNASSIGMVFIDPKAPQYEFVPEPAALPLPAAAVAAIPAIGIALIARRRMNSRRAA